MPKSDGGAFTVNVTVVECTRLPLVPVTVMVNEPVGVEPVVVIDSGYVPADTGLVIVQVALEGHPLTASDTVLENPFNAVTVMFELPEPPAVSASEVGLADIVKSGDVDVEPHDVSLNDPNQVLQLKEPSAARYSLVYQKVQSSTGSIRMAL